MKMLAGFKSRCMILCLCICCKALAIWWMYSQTRRSGKEMSSSIDRLITSFRSPFSTYSTAMNNSLSLLSINQLRYFTMFGWSKVYNKISTICLPDVTELLWDMRLAVSNCPYRKSVKLANTFTLISLSATSELSAIRFARNTKENFP